MSKKKNFKRRKYRSQRRLSPTACDKHHLIYQGRNWKRRSLKELRMFWYCIMYIPRNTLHREIHANLGTIPVPDEGVAKNVLRRLKIYDDNGELSHCDPLEKRLALLADLFERYEAFDTAGAMRKQLSIAKCFYNRFPYLRPQPKLLSLLPPATEAPE